MPVSDRVAELFGRAKKVRELKESVVRHDRIDDGVLGDLVDRAEHFRTAMYTSPEIELGDEATDEQREAAQNYSFWGDLFSDTFRALHTYATPELESRDQIKPSRELNRRIIGSMMSADSFDRLRPRTRHDDIASAIASMSLTEKLRETLTNELQEMVERSEEMGERESEIEEIEDEIDQLENPSGAGDQPGDGTPQEARNGIPGGPGPMSPEQLEERLRELNEQRDEKATELAEIGAQQEQQGIGTKAIEAVEEAVEEAQEDADMLSSLPGTEPGQGKRLNPDEIVDLAEKWKSRPNMREIADMVGRMVRDLRYKRTNRITGGREEIVDVKVGDDLSLLLPIEKMRIRHPVFGKDFKRRYYERSLLQYETQGYAEAGRGPVIVCIDGSSSMNGAKNVWARAVALSLIVIAKREKRDAAAVEFSSTGQVERWDFLAKEPVAPDKVLDFAGHMFSGGTDITSGITSSLELIEQVPQFKTADIVLISDGDDHFQEDDEKLKDELDGLGVRVHGVSIGADSYSYLAQMCESVVPAYDLAGSNEATDHLAAVIS